MNFRRPAALLLALAPLLALAQPRDERRGPRVILFEHANFQGGAIVVYAGESVDNFARWTFDNGRNANDRVSSLRIEGGAEVTVFTDAKFRGQALRLTGDVRDLARGDERGVRFNDAISSLRVEAVRRGRDDDWRPDDRGGHGNGRGSAVDPEKIVRRAYQDILEREPDPEGLRRYRSQIIDRGWTEKQVRDSLRASEEYRVTYMTARLNRLYREILGRDVDARGFDHYRNKIIEHGWGDDDIRRDLRNSAEFRNRPRTQNP